MLKKRYKKAKEYIEKMKNKSLNKVSIQKNKKRPEHSKFMKTWWKQNKNNNTVKKRNNNISKALTGRKLTEKHIQYIKENKERARNISNALTGRKLTKEHCQHISESLNNRKLSKIRKWKQYISRALTGYTQTKEHKQNTRKSKLEYYKTHKSPRFETITSEITKEKLRISQFEYIKNTRGITYPNIGKHENQILDKLQNILGFSIKRQFYINGYFLDGYCQELNLAIEIDEEFHYRNNILKHKDFERQNNIINALNCSFLRLKVENIIVNNKINNEALIA